MKKAKICSICGSDYDGYGNNADPFIGRCCNDCNLLHVIPARISLIYAAKKDNPKEPVRHDKG